MQILLLRQHPLKLSLELPPAFLDLLLRSVIGLAQRFTQPGPHFPRLLLDLRLEPGNVLAHFGDGLRLRSAHRLKQPGEPVDRSEC